MIFFTNNFVVVVYGRLHEANAMRSVILLSWENLKMSFQVTCYQAFFGERGKGRKAKKERLIHLLHKSSAAP